MTKTEQKAFVRGLSKTIADEIIKQISEGRIPEEWDGHELRALLAYRHEQSAAMSLVRRDRRRKRDFDNTLLVNNL